METGNLKAANFEELVRSELLFLEEGSLARFSGTCEVKGDPRDQSVIVRYSASGYRIDVAYSEIERCIMISVHLNRDDLKGNQKYVYFEQYVYFLSGCAVAPVVPQIYPSTSIGGIEKAVEARQELFDTLGEQGVISALSNRLRTYLDDVVSAPSQQILRYHDWYRNFRG